MSGRIRALKRDESTLVRYGGTGDNFHMTWMRDGRQVVSVCDGRGWLADPRGYYNNRLFTMDGRPPSALALAEIPAYPTPPMFENAGHPAYFGFGTVAIGDDIHQFLSTFGHDAFRRVRLVSSSDGGLTWHEGDPARPVEWDRESHLFDESDDAFGLLTVVQMGRGYASNRDGFLYVLAPNGSREGSMNELVLFRVRIERIRRRSAYEFFGGTGIDGMPRWSPDIADRRPVHTFPSGWVNRTPPSVHPYSWHPSVVYVEALDTYLMTNWGMGCDDDGNWFAKPSYLGFWTAPAPWGPWKQVHEETEWTPGGDRKARAYQPQIAPAWIAPDGRSFWLVWTDFQYGDGFWEFHREAMRELAAAATIEEHTAVFTALLRRQPYYGFNAQLVEVIVDDSEEMTT